MKTFSQINCVKYKNMLKVDISATPHVLLKNSYFVLITRFSFSLHMETVFNSLLSSAIHCSLMTVLKCYATDHIHTASLCPSLYIHLYLYFSISISVSRLKKRKKPTEYS